MEIYSIKYNTIKGRLENVEYKLDVDVIKNNINGSNSLLLPIMVLIILISKN